MVKKGDIMARGKDQIPEQFNSIEEIQDFWDEHSTTDYWDEMEDVDLQLSPALKSKLELKKLYRLLGLSDKQITEIEAKAKLQNVDSKQLIRKWVLEHV
jgi:hypothetical protein